jgi:anti-sigma regulatory factor (Ser/Thr protein kinase)
LTFRLAAEEAFTNIIVHGYDADAARARVEVRAYASDEEIGLELIDQGTPFDPASAPPADVKSGWEERPIGGVGWHLIRELTDRIRYQPNTPMGNRLMLVKRRTAPNETNQEST